MRILLVEDDISLQESLAAILRQAGYAVDVSGDGIEGLFFGEEYPIDLAIIDLGLPGMSGIDVIRKLREGERRFPILILTARAEWQDKVEGLESGADDYLTKPFAFAELLVRIKNLLRRVNQTDYASTVLQIADLKMDIAKRTVSRGGQIIKLTAKEFALLQFFLERQGEVLPRSVIASQVWDINFDSDTNVIDVAIRRLRIKIDDDFDIKLIHTVRGMGYRLDHIDNTNDGDITAMSQ